MELIIIIFLIVLLMILLGRIVSSNQNNMLFVKSCMLASVFIIIGYISLVVSIILLLAFIEFLNINFNNLFAIGIILISLAGIFQLLLVKGIFKNKKIDSNYILVIEHLIQWILIYFVIYQTATQKIMYDKEAIKELDLQNFLDISNLNILFLPALIITWITIFSFRIK
ncbi:SA1002 family membrane protein [Staphylococcus agnetis]|nr:hypothetical protein [Staphylococcus agnetis]MDG4943500.1 hypothetical protein [Staphylococcus agnetis]